MRIIIILVIYSLYLIQTLDSKKFRVIGGEEILHYIDKSIKACTDVVSIDHLKFELIDDDLIELGGYIEWKESMNPNLPVTGFFRTQYYDNSIWNEGMLRLSLPSTCPEFINPTRPFYNITKLWTNCPPLKGDKWLIELQNVSIVVDLPPSIPIVPWRLYILFMQGLPGLETFKCGYGITGEIVPV